MAKPDSKIYTTRELTAFFRVSEKTIWEWCRIGKLPAFKIGKEWRVRAEDLRRIIDAKVRSADKKANRLF
jgi:putative molybdopterin biosynthesis protein